MSPLLGYLSLSDTRVCQLYKSLYGFKQAPCQWFKKFSLSLTKFGFVQSHHDHSLFTLTEDTSFLTLFVYVNDMVIARNDIFQIQKLKNYLNIYFSIKDLGTFKYFLGLELTRSLQGISLCQCKHTFDLLKEIGMSSNKTSFRIKDPSQCCCLIRRLIYLTISRPNITSAIQLLSQVMQKPSYPHLDAIYHVLRYLKSSSGQGLLFLLNSNFYIKAYYNAD